MIDPVTPDPPVELSAVLADDELVDRLSRRTDVSDTEPLARLLASWVSQVDTAVEHDLAAEPVPAPVLALAGASPHRSRRLARGSRLAVVVTAVGVGLGSLTGVAAAVTGDPLAPYRPVISGVLGGAAGGGSGSTQPVDPGTTTEGPQDATRQADQQHGASAKGEHPAAGLGSTARQARTDGWLAHWPGLALPPQAVGPDQRPGLDGTAGTSRPGGPSRADADLRGPDSSRADQVRRDGDKRPDNGGDDSAVRRGAGGSDDGSGSDRSGAPTTPPGHQVPRR